MNPSNDGADTLQQVDGAIELRENFYAGTPPALCITGIKFICDGAVDACTEALTQPYNSNNVS